MRRCAAGREGVCVDDSAGSVDAKAHVDLLANEAQGKKDEVAAKARFYAHKAAQAAEKVAAQAAHKQAAPHKRGRRLHERHHRKKGVSKANLAP